MPNCRKKVAAYVRLRVGQYNYNRTDMSHIVPTEMKSRVPKSLPTTISRPKPKAVDTVSNLSVACKTLSGTHFYDTFNFYCIQNGYKVTIEQPVSGVGINEFHRRL